MSDDDLDEILESDLFDVSDVTLEFQRSKGTCKIYLIMKSERPINLMRFYLKLKEYVFRMEQEIGILEEDFEEH